MKLVLCKKLMLEIQWKGKQVSCDMSVNDAFFLDRVVGVMAGVLSRVGEGEKMYLSPPGEI